jgi:hypothetical protein
MVKMIKGLDDAGLQLSQKGTRVLEELECALEEECSFILNRFSNSMAKLAWGSFNGRFRINST